MVDLLVAHFFSAFPFLNPTSSLCSLALEPIRIFINYRLLCMAMTFSEPHQSAFSLTLQINSLNYGWKFFMFYCLNLSKDYIAVVKCSPLWWVFSHFLHHWPFLKLTFLKQTKIHISSSSGRYLLAHRSSNRVTFLSNGPNSTTVISLVLTQWPRLRTDVTFTLNVISKSHKRKWMSILYDLFSARMVKLCLSTLCYKSFFFIFLRGRILAWILFFFPPAPYTMQESYTAYLRVFMNLEW